MARNSFGLSRQREVRDPRRETGCRRRRARTCRGGPADTGRGPFLDAEQLGLEQGFNQGGAVDRDERPSCRRLTELVDLTSDQLFADPLSPKRPGHSEIRGGPAGDRLDQDGKRELKLSCCGRGQLVGWHQPLRALQPVLDDDTPVARRGGIVRSAMACLIIRKRWPRDVGRSARDPSAVNKIRPGEELHWRACRKTAPPPLLSFSFLHGHHRAIRRQVEVHVRPAPTPASYPTTP